MKNANLTALGCSLRECRAIDNTIESFEDAMHILFYINFINNFNFNTIIGGFNMVYDAKNYDYLITNLKGFSEAQLKAHFGLYQGYVKKMNEIAEKLKIQDKSVANYSYGEFSELKRREAVAFNGTFLHELYFENLSGVESEPSAELRQELVKSFGSWDNFVADVKQSAVSTPGWVVLTWNKITKQLHTYIMYEHHIGLPAHQEIILALDCWEHAFMIDFGTDKASYLKTFFESINWNVVNMRFENIK